MEESNLISKLVDDILRFRGWLQEIDRHGRVLQQVTGPKPDGAPGVERTPQMPICGSRSEVFFVLTPPFLVVVDRQRMEPFKYVDQMVVRACRRQLFLKERESVFASRANQLNQ